MTESDEDDRGRVGVLLVGDQSSRLADDAALLGGFGHEVRTVGPDLAALDEFGDFEFAAVVLDAVAPKSDAAGAIARLRGRPQFERTPVIVLAEYRKSDADRTKACALGAVDYAYVPLAPDILRNKIETCIELHGRRRESKELDRRLEKANAEASAADCALGAEVVVRERLEETLRETLRRKDEFLALLAHEVRNPLAPIVNAVEIMRLQEIDNPELAWCRDVVDRQSQRLKRLVEDLLDVSRITQGAIQLQKAPVLVSNVVERAIEISRAAIDAKHQQLGVEQPGHPIRVQGDLARLAQVVGNLLDNAAKFTEEGGRIRVVVEELARTDGAAEAIIRVKDDGVGIPSETLPHVFELFNRGGRTPDRAQGGLGIGLTLVARLVALHGGTATARSDGPGTGSEFEIRLPVLVERPADAHSKIGARAKSPVESAQRVLVVDDDADAARSLAVLLEASGNVVRTAYDGAQAVEAADEFRPDVVLLDIAMPKLDGFGAARWIREQSWARNVLLVALTGWGRQDVHSLMTEAGFDAHMAKPVDFAALAALFAKLPSGNRSGLVEIR